MISEFVNLNFLVFFCQSLAIHGQFNYPPMDHCGLYDGSCSDAMRSKECTCRTYTFGIPLGKHVIINPETGEYGGPVVQMINKVCELAGKLCNFGSPEVMSCWDETWSDVLNGRWYDACLPFGQTAERNAKYDFLAMSIFRNTTGVILASKDSNFTGEDLRHPNDLRLGWPELSHITFYPALDAFLNSGYFVKEKNIIRVTGTIGEVFQTLFSGVECGTINGSPVDYLLSLENRAHYNGSLRIVGEFNFTLPTDKIMIRKDEQCLLQWFNEAYEELVCSDEFPAFCMELSEGVADFCHDRPIMCS